MRAEIGRSAGQGRKARPVKLRWVTDAVGLPPGVDVSGRAAMHDWLRQQR